MRVFVAGGSGVLGRFRVPQLVSRSHQVTALATNVDKLSVIRDAGGTGVVMGGPDGAGPWGKANTKRPARRCAIADRVHVEGTDHRLAAAEAAGAVQGYPKWNGAL
jgi:nucleoside-diphosphate-sugar epimerase